jgi:FkbM family methyltransferase
MLFDIGANCGNYTNANIDKYSKIICVDASGLQCELLKKNVPSDKCTIVHTLVSSVDTAKFYRCSASGISSASLDWVLGKGRFAPGNRYYEPSFQWTLDPVSITSLDQLIEIYGVPSFIKIDVEGHELEVIKSLTKYSGTIAFEWAEEMKTEAIETINYISAALGHKKFYIQSEDAYTFVPDDNSYVTKEEIIEIIHTTWVPKRQELWGMIWCLQEL